MTQTNPCKGCIVIVDDNPQNLATLKQMLIDDGYDVRPAINGDTALVMIGKILPDLILLDIIMPDMDGYEVCRRLKADETTRNISVIFLSALDKSLDKVKAFEVGGVDYITKPFQIEEVLIRVKTHIELRNMQKALEEKNVQFEEALANLKTLSGLLPICANCKKIRDDKGYWTQLEKYIEMHSEALFSHGICPECMEQLYGDQEWYQRIQNSAV